MTMSSISNGSTFADPMLATTKKATMPENLIVKNKTESKGHRQGK